MKLIPTDYYLDGYNVEQIRCWDLSKACACGCFNRELYYLYCFLYAMYRLERWNDENITTLILNQLGLKQTEYRADSKKDLLSKIYSEIDKGNPVLLVLNYNTIYFNSLYKEDVDSRHDLLINGYDSKKAVLNIKDYLYVRKFVKTVIPRNVEVFVDNQIKNEHLIEMWQESKEKGVNNLLVLEREKDCLIKDYVNLLELFLENVHIKRENYQCYDNRDAIDYADIRKRLYNSIDMMLDVIRRAIYKEDCFSNIIQKEEVGEQINRILKHRNAASNLYIRDLMKNKFASDETINEMLSNDKQIFDFIHNLYQLAKYQQNEKTDTLVNVALDAKVMCDYEGANALAKYAVSSDAKDKENCWLSDHRYEEHWLIVDLQNRKKVKRFIVRHHPYKRNLVTCAFRIEGSNDMKCWDVLACIKNNEKHENVIDINSICYRYFRLYIEKANIINENAARIYSFEIYADCQEV